MFEDWPKGHFQYFELYLKIQDGVKIQNDAQNEKKIAAKWPKINEF
jgi:hypothetical protein